MKKINKMAPKGIVLILALAIFIGLCAVGCSNGGGIQEVLSEEEYTYVNPDESKAETDEGIVIDGVLDEEVYQNNNWLYLHNDEGNNVDIAMTSYYGEKGMYFVYDVTESVPIYVNLNRPSYMNSCIEMYLAPSNVTSMSENSVFEIDMLPTGDMVFKKSNGKGGYVGVATTNDIMAYLGATTKGGEINTGDCYGYCLELFIPWDYMEWVGMDAEAMKESFVYVDPAHITSYNLTGTDTNVDRYWYFFAKQQGATFANVYQYFRFDGTGALGTVPVEVTEGKNCTVEADSNVIPGVKTTITIKPENGFAMNSIRVNGEERIQSVSYNADGSVDITIRPSEEGLKISAAAEAVTDGAKTLSGTVRLSNLEEDTLEGVVVKYNGPDGIKPITLDENGSFVLENLAQGYYTLEVEKEGYQPISRGICLNRDIDADLVLEFDTFFTQNGAAFLLDEQNSGVVQKFGGTGYIMSNQAYDKFTYEMNIRYDAELAKEAAPDAFKQQRTGMRILFSNGKYLYIDMLKQGNDYIVQYANHSNAIFGGWPTICKLNEKQIAKYKSEEGITLKVVRDGRFVGIFLDDILLRVEKLAYEYAYHTAQLGMESWSANRGVMEIPYSIDRGISVCVAASDFYRAGNWNITGQYDGYVMLDNGGDGGWLNFGEKYVNSDVSIIVKDYPEAETEPDGFRTVIRHTFDNGETASFSVYYNADGKYAVQSMGDTTFGWKYHYWLTEEEVAKLTSDGIELRVVRIGTEISCYLDGKEVVSGADLTVDKNGKNSGIKADMPSTVAIRHYGDEGVPVMIPYEMADALDYVKVTSVETEFGKVATNKENYVRGDIVTLSDSGEGAYYPYAVKVNSEPVELGAYGNYSFVAEEDEYIVEGEFAERIFYNADEWNEVEQNVGVLSIPNSDGDSYWVYSYRSDYKDFDFKTTLHDFNNTDDNYRGAVRLGFANGQDVTFTITNDRKNDDATTVYELQNMNGTLHSWALPGYTLSEEQVKAIQSKDGLEFRVVRVGDVVDVYVGGEHACEYDLSSGDVADQGAQIRMRFYGNNGKDVEVPFTITEGTPKLVKVTDESDKTLGTVAATNKNILIGEKVTLAATAKDGYYCGAMTVDGKSITANADGTYSFVATKENHTVKGTFYKLIFKDTNTNWNVYNQHNGILSYTIPSGAKNTGTVNSYQIYNNVDFTITLKDVNPSARNFRGGINLDFGDGKWVAFSLTNDGTANADIYEVQNVNDPMLGWFKPGYTLSTEQIAKIRGNGLEFRIVRVGATADLYIDGQHIYEYDLSTMKDGKTPSGVANKTTDVQVRIYGAGGQTGEVPFVLKDSVDLVNVNVSAGANGTVTADQKTYLPGETVNLTVQGNSGYAHDSFKVGGADAVTDLYGKYSFVINADTNVSATFKKSIFKSTVEGWLLENQHYGQIAVSWTNGSGNSNWAEFADKYTDVDITMNAREYPDTAKPKYTRSAIRFIFDNGKTITFSIAKNTEGSGFKYSVQALSGDNIVSSSYDFYVMNDEQIAKFNSAEGIEFRVVRKGTKAYVYLDGVLVVEGFDLAQNNSGVAADTPAAVYLRRFDDPNILAVYDNFSVSTALTTVKVNIADTTRGTVTADQDSYLVGETVKLTVAGDSGYYHTGLYVNGEKVTVSTDGTYSFVATANSYNVTCNFAEGVFEEGDARWNLINQNVGVLSVPSTTSDTGWRGAKGNWNELSITVKDYAGGARHEYAAVGSLYFTNGKHVSIRLIYDQNNDRYSLQSMGDSVFSWTTHYTLTDAQKAKVQGEGIKFTMTRRGTLLDLYLDGVPVATKLDLTGRSSGITADMTCGARVRYYNFGYAAEMPFELGNPDQNVTLNITATNGTVTTDKSSYLVGETVKLTVKGNDGYYYTGVTVNGNPVTLDWNGNYSFKATENTYNVAAYFAPTVFTGGDMRHWDITKQHVGELRLKSHSSGHSGWIDYTGTCNDVTMVVKNHNVDSKDFNMTYMFKFSNGEVLNLRIHNTDTDGKYRVQSLNGSNLYNSWVSNYTFSDAETAAVTGDGIKYRVIILNDVAHVYLNDVKVCEYVFKKSVGNATVTVTLQMHGNLNNDVYMTYQLKNTTELP